MKILAARPRFVLPPRFTTGNDYCKTKAVNRPLTKRFVKGPGLLIPFLCLLLSPVSPAAGQEAVKEGAVKAAPAGAVAIETLPPPAAGPAVVELFSSQACVFCPGADRLFAELAAQPGTIGLACHVDYFDVKTGSLAHDFCTRRQGWYLDVLDAGPYYTPQMVVGGRAEAVGYRQADVIRALRDTPRPQPVDIKETGMGSYGLSFSVPLAPEGERDVRLWLALYDSPHDVTVAEGRNRGQKMVYYNIVSGLKDLGPVPPGVTARSIEPALEKTHAGFAVLVQDMASGEILAAGAYAAKAPPLPQP